MEPPIKVAPIAIIAVAGQAFAFAISVTLARVLDVRQFEAYVVAASAFLFLVALAPLGIEKYALRLLPTLIERTDWARARGYLRFATRRILICACTIAAIVAVAAWAVHGIDGATRSALIASSFALPIGAAAHFGVEVLAAAGRETWSTAIARLLVPAMAMCIVAFLALLGFKPDATVAIGAWTVGWAAAIVVLGIAIRRVMPVAVRVVEPVEEARAWAAAAMPFLVHRGTMSVLGQGGILLLDFLHASPAGVGAYAAALATVAPATMLITATNRAYARRLSIGLEKGDTAAILEARRARLNWLLPAVALPLLAALVFAPDLIGLFGAAYVEEGATCLRILAFATAFSVTFSLAPTYVKFTRHRRLTIPVMVAAAGIQVVLLFILIPLLGAAGAALAHGLSMAGMYGTFAIVAWRDLHSGRPR